MINKNKITLLISNYAKLLMIKVKSLRKRFLIGWSTYYKLGFEQVIEASVE